MEPNTLNSSAEWLPIASMILTIVGLVAIFIQVRQSAKSLSRSIEGHSYNVWRTVYEKLVDCPKAAEFFGFRLKRHMDPKMLAIFLMILDMYANMYSGRYDKLPFEATLLQKIMKSQKSREYWKECKAYFFSGEKFIEEIDKMAKT